MKINSNKNSPKFTTLKDAYLFFYKQTLNENNSPDSILLIIQDIIKEGIDYLTPDFFYDIIKYIKYALDSSKFYLLLFDIIESFPDRFGRDFFNNFLQKFTLNEQLLLIMRLKKGIDYLTPDFLDNLIKYIKYALNSSKLYLLLFDIIESFPDKFGRDFFNNFLQKFTLNEQFRLILRFDNRLLYKEFYLPIIKNIIKDKPDLDFYILKTIAQEFIEILKDDTKINFFKDLNFNDKLYIVSLYENDFGLLGMFGSKDEDIIFKLINFFKEVIEKIPESFLSNKNPSYYNLLFIQLLKEKFNIVIPFKSLLLILRDHIKDINFLTYFINNLNDYPEILKEEIFDLKSELFNNIFLLDEFLVSGSKILKDFFSVKDYEKIIKLSPASFIRRLMPHVSPYQLYKFLNEYPLEEKIATVINEKLDELIKPIESVDVLESILKNPHYSNDYKIFEINNFEKLNDPQLDDYLNLFIEDNNPLNEEIISHFILNHKFYPDNELELFILDSFLEHDSNKIKREAIEKIKYLFKDESNLEDFQENLLNSALEVEKNLNNQKLSFYLFKLSKLILTSKII